MKKDIKALIASMIASLSIIGASYCTKLIIDKKNNEEEISDTYIESSIDSISNIDKKYDANFNDVNYVSYTEDTNIEQIPEINENIISLFGYFKYDTECTNLSGDIILMEAYQKISMIYSDSYYTKFEYNNDIYYASNESIETLPGAFVETDLSERIVRLYYNYNLINEYLVSIGAPSTPTDIGYFTIYAKTYDRYLDGDNYHTYVNFFFPYNGGEGFHDFPGYTSFGEEASHGCTRMSYDDIDELDKYVKVGTPVLVHK